MRAFLIMILLTQFTYASVRVLNFNTMCDVCNGSSLSLFNQRLLTIKNLITKYKPDLIALQELRSQSHLDFLVKNSPELLAIHHRGVINYTDSVLIINKNKFKVLDQGHFWMGPTPNKFQLGWSPALPRILVWAELIDRASKQKFVFMSSHFDNLILNLRESAKLFSKLIENFERPILFAGDTNITMDMPAFTQLRGHLNSVFNSKMKLESISKNLKNKEVCYRRKGRKFPDCIVEHIFYDAKLGWTQKSLIIDTTNFLNGYPSDHRPMIVDFH